MLRFRFWLADRLYALADRIAGRPGGPGAVTGRPGGPGAVK